MLIEVFYALISMVYDTRRECLPPHSAHRLAFRPRHFDPTIVTIVMDQRRAHGFDSCSLRSADEFEANRIDMLAVQPDMELVHFSNPPAIQFQEWWRWT